MPSRVIGMLVAVVLGCVHRGGQPVPSHADVRLVRTASRPRPVALDAGVVIPARIVEVTHTRPTFARPEQIVATALRTPVHAAPREGSRVFGELAEGAVVNVIEGPSGRDGCLVHTGHPEGGWYEVEGGGYVCVGGALAIPYPAADLVAPTAPDMGAAMPFAYATSRGESVMYRRLPSVDDLRRYEPWRFPRPAMNRPAPAREAFGPPRLTDRSRLRLADLDGSPRSAVLRTLLPGMSLALDRRMEDTAVGERYWRTQGGGYVRVDQLAPLRTIPTFHGVELGAGASLPMAWMNSTRGVTYQLVMSRTGVALRVKSPRRVPRWTAIPLADAAPIVLGARSFVRARDGRLVDVTDVRRATLRPPPARAGPTERWLDIDLDEQVLVAYEGARPVFATLVSSGVSDPDDPTKNHETPAGSFQIEAKHVTASMARDTASDGPYDLEDVPWVMFYRGAFALHGAYWHRQFGRPMSHGCINLSPADARRVFLWADPQLPARWNGVYAHPGHTGSRVEVRHSHTTQAVVRRVGVAGDHCGLTDARERPCAAVPVRGHPGSSSFRRAGRPTGRMHRPGVTTSVFVTKSVVAQGCASGCSVLRRHGHGAFGGNAAGLCMRRAGVASRHEPVAREGQSGDTS